uniref:Uncharacterized protein n=1 Tax=viral metagenome TaxID=1070528 RepID=A0A6M3LM10_9ZZZZ
MTETERRLLALMQAAGNMARERCWLDLGLFPYPLAWGNWPWRWN